MPAIFVIDRSAKEPSPLVRRLIRGGYHVLCLADCRTALEAMRCILPEMMIVDIASVGVRAAVGTVTALGRDDAKGRRPAVPVLIVGANPAERDDLKWLLHGAEVLPATRSSPDEVLEHVGRYFEPDWPPPEADDRPAPRKAGSGPERRESGRQPGSLVGEDDSWEFPVARQ